MADNDGLDLNGGTQERASFADAVQEIVPAGFNERFIAYVIDALPFVLGIYLTLPFAKDIVAGSSFGVVATWKLVWIVAYILYETILSSGGRATLGKYLMGIRVKAMDGGDLPVPRAFVRAIAYFVSSALLNLGYLLALVTPGKRALHDYAAGSRVVSVKERGDLADGLILAFSWALMVIFSVSWLYQVNKNLLQMGPAEKKQVMMAHKTIVKLAKLEEIHRLRYGGYTNDMRRLAFMTGNVSAVQNEIYRTLDPATLTIASDGRGYIISARAKNKRQTLVEVSSIPEK